MFADDTAIYCSSETIKEVNGILQQDVEKAITWFHDNLLTVNIDKSCAIAVSTSKRLHNQLGELNITVTDDKLVNVDSIKYLGITIDNNLEQTCQ